MNNVLAVTLARGGSKGVPHKHTRLLHGKPVLEYTIDAVHECKYVTDYVISSDDPEIIRIAERCAVDTILRPSRLAADTTPTLPALLHAVETFEDRVGYQYEYIAEVRATSPLKTAEDIDRIIEILMASGADSVIGVTALEDHHPARAKWMDEKGILHDFIPEPASGRRQDLEPKAYIRNGTVYALKREALMGEGGKLFGHTFSIGYVMETERSINIDGEVDFLLAECLIGRRNGKLQSRCL